jgi:ABC-2 type transport system ATP-binding protein
MIEVSNLYKRFGSIEAVRGVSFRVAPGEIFGLLGPNGAGKSTTIAMLCGLLAPDAGVARLDGIDVVVRPTAARRVLGLAVGCSR